MCDRCSATRQWYRLYILQPPDPSPCFTLLPDGTTDTPASHTPTSHASTADASRRTSTSAAGCLSRPDMEGDCCRLFLGRPRGTTAGCRHGTIAGNGTFRDDASVNAHSGQCTAEQSHAVGQL